MKSVYGLKFSIHQTRNPNPVDVELVENAFLLWHFSWCRTFSELGVNVNLRSDDFLDREMGVLTADDQPIGMLFYNWLDTSRLSNRLHSYFKDYPPSVLEVVPQSKVMLISYMTLHESWRWRFTDVPVGEMLIGFSVKRFLQTDAKILLGYFRNEKRTNQMFYSHGGTPILTNHTTYNVDVDYAFIDKELAHDSTNKHVAEAVNALWNQWLGSEEIARSSHGLSRGDFKKATMG